MGALCSAPCFIHMLQIPSKGFQTRSFVFLAHGLFVWFIARALHRLFLWWECFPATAQLLCCTDGAVLCWQSCALCCFSALAASPCAWNKEPKQSCEWGGVPVTRIGGVHTELLHCMGQIKVGGASAKQAVSHWVCDLLLDLRNTLSFCSSLEGGGQTHVKMVYWAVCSMWDMNSHLW